MNIKRNLLRLVYMMIIILPMITSCATMPPTRDLPPILTQDELIQSYVKLGRIQAIREVYWIADHQIHPDIREWGLNAIREEAVKLGADAVILPEVTGRTTTYLVIPITEYRATGIAIKFK